MDIQLKDRIVLQLQEISREQTREISDILQDAIEEYVEKHTNETKFRATVQGTMTRHKWLLDELKKR